MLAPKSQIIVLFVFTTIASLSVALPLAAYFLARQRVEGTFARWKDWLIENNLTVVWGCGKCRSRRSGADNYCDHPNPAGSGGLGRNGGLADYMIVPVGAMVPLNSQEPADAVPLTDAVLTSYHALKQCLPLLTPDTAAVDKTQPCTETSK